jgi:hypothetical protein
MKVVLLTCFALFTLILLARNFNQVLQQFINPPSPDQVEISRAGVTLRVGIAWFNRPMITNGMYLMEIWV